MTPKKTCMPPDPNTRVPRFNVPAEACDAHCHIFGPAHLFPYHESSSYIPPDAGKDRLKNLHNILGIERAVIIQASCNGPDNRAMLDAIASSDGAYRGVCLGSKDFSDNDFIDLNTGGVRGIRFNFVAHLGGAPDLAEMKEILDRVIGLDMGWHLVIHVDAEDIVTYETFFSQFEMPIIVDHMGRIPTQHGLDQPAFQILLDFMQRDNWWVKICGAERISASGPPFHDAIPYAQALVQAAPDRILWGTDFPHPNIKTHMPNDGDLVDLIPLIADDATLQQKILVDNPARLYGFTVV